MPEWDLFITPFATGLVLAVMLPVLGAYLRLRQEWLAALCYAHVAAAGALLSPLLGGSAVLGGLLLSGVAGGGKRLMARLQGEAGYAVLLLAAWAGAQLMIANWPLSERLGRALFDGQLYFAGRSEWWWAALGSTLIMTLLRYLSSRLLLLHLYPDFFRGRAWAAWPIDAGFNVLSGLALGLATLSLGVMGSFALVFIPPWLAFRRAGSWRLGLIRAVLIGVSAYVIAFTLALLGDQPFGPVLALCLVLLGVLVA